MHVQKMQQEDGYIVVVVVIMFLMVLSMMGMATYTLSRSEGTAVSNKVEKTQLTYAMMGGAEFALAAYQVKNFEEGYLPFPIGSVEVYADTVVPTDDEIADYGINRKLIVTVSGGESNEEIVVFFQGNSNDFSQAAIFVTGDNDVTVTNGGDVITGVEELPGIDTGTLYDLANSQGQVQTNNLTLSSNYGASFYQSGSTPSVTWVPGNLIVSASRIAYGIFVVGGNVTIASTAQIVGVVYFTTSGRIVTLAASASVTGGIVGNGDVQGTSTSRVQYNETYMTVFDSYRTDETQEMVSNEYWVFW